MSEEGRNDQDKPDKWRWPDFAPYITFLAASSFIASLLYVEGLSMRIPNCARLAFLFA
ncbi:MAG: hypothetical protein JO151_02270 [Verrucomicrobia bacterium]|nr:hypothetical protein [Verrucomicrobiota bacterium]